MVVEHEEEIIRAADEIIDIGPLAGRLGGEIVFHGNYGRIAEKDEGLTANICAVDMKIEVPAFRRKWNNFIEITGARENNLKNIQVKFP